MAKKQPTRSKPKQEKPKRSLKRVEFWLDRNDPTQAYLLTVIEQFKEERRFAPTLRQALELVADLQRGSTRTLESYYPWATQMTKHSATSVNPEIMSQLQRLEQLMEGQQNQSIPKDTKGSKTLDMSTDFGMDDLNLEVATASGNSLNGQNLLDSFFNL